MEFAIPDRLSAPGNQDEMFMYGKRYVLCSYEELQTENESVSRIWLLLAHSGLFRMIAPKTLAFLKIECVFRI